MKLKVTKLNNNATIPTKGSKYAAGYDLYAAIEKDTTIRTGMTYLVPTGIAIEIPQGYAGFIFARSGLATKQGLAPANKVGVIDADYRGEVIVSLFNHSTRDWVITPNQRIAQLVIMKVEDLEIEEVSQLSDSSRGQGGFGSTGK